jgi:hypothetical protein
MEPRRLVKVPMTDVYWPFGLAALQDDQLAASAQAVAAGAVGWEAFSSELETGTFDVTADLGWGFLAPERKHVPVRRNRRGLSFARRTIRGDFVKRLRIEPAHAPCVLRIDWISLRCMVHGRPDPELVEIESPEQFSRLVKLRRCRELSPKLLMVPGDSPELIVDVERAVGAPVWRLEFECAFAVLPLERSQARERWARLRAGLLRLAKESRLGAPLRLARRALGR